MAWPVVDPPSSVARSDQRHWSRMQIGTFNWKVNPTMGHDYSRLPGSDLVPRYSFVCSQLFQIPHCPGIRINWVLRSRYLRKHFPELNGIHLSSPIPKVPTYISNVIIYYVSPKWIALICSANKQGQRKIR